MRLTLSWLREYVDFNVSAQELAERLTMSGLEVESLEYLGKGLEEIVAANIKDIRPHPNAQKLVICDVTDGKSHFKIVCGAKNMKLNDNVALARAGTRLHPSSKYPEGINIKTTTIRGEVSEGMLCSELEIGIGESEEGIMILPESARAGDRLVDVLGLDDYVLELGITPNRPDCLSVLGIAREVAAISGLDVKYPTFEVTEGGEDIYSIATVEVLDPEGCPRYSCRVIKDVKIGPSPDWLRIRLERSGIRSINNVVDITNYVLLELGQPLHAFDYDLLSDNKIIVRSAYNGESIETLDGIERNLDEEDLLICDAEKPIAIAGVMGGTGTQVSESTRNILLESAFFNPYRIRRTSKKTGLRSESSFRFERQVDIDGVVNALDRASYLLMELAGGKICKGRIDAYPNVVKPKELRLSTRRANALLGTTLKSQTIKDILGRLGFQSLGSNGDELKFLIPTFRVDVTREIDLIEELARHYGYDRIPVTRPTVSMKADGLDRVDILVNKVRQSLVTFGFLEAINYSFDDPEFLSLFGSFQWIKILNPISKEGSVMRTYLFSSLLRNIILNLNYQEEEIKMYEFGRTYLQNGSGLPIEINKLAAATTSVRKKTLWGKGDYDFYDLKGTLERILEIYTLVDKAHFDKFHKIGFLHPGKSARVLIDNEEVGFIGELHPEILERLRISERINLFEINLDRIERVSRDITRKFKTLTRYPTVRRDIALVLDEDVDVGEIVEEIRKVESNLIDDITVFDVFKGGTVEKGKKSVAFSVNLRAPDKTLTDEEVNQFQAKALDRVRLVFGAELRKI